MEKNDPNEFKEKLEEIDLKDFTAYTDFEDKMLGYTEENSAAPVYERHQFESPEIKQPVDENEMQRVWRTASGEANSSSGYFVWEVLQVMGKITPQRYFVECRDGSFIMIQCYHFWTIEAAGKHLHDVGIVGMEEFQTIEIVG